MTVYARAGEVITCAAGHPLARLVRDVLVGERQSADVFDAIADVKPGDQFCPVCGAKIGGDSIRTEGCYYFAGRLRGCEGAPGP